MYSVKHDATQYVPHPMTRIICCKAAIEAALPTALNHHGSGRVVHTHHTDLDT